MSQKIEELLRSLHETAEKTLGKKISVNIIHAFIYSFSINSVYTVYIQ